MKKIVLLLMAALAMGTAMGQTKTIPVTTDNGQRVMTGFESIVHRSDEALFENAVLWVVDNVCGTQLDAVKSVDYDGRSLKFGMTVASPQGGKLKNLYTVTVSVRVQEHRVVYYISDIAYQSQSSMAVSRVTLLNKLNPETRANHKEVVDDCSVAVSEAIGRMLAFMDDNSPKPVTHWSEIKSHTPVKGMTVEECKLSFGKPQYVSESGGETQWMYNSTFYIFFRGGVVSSVIK